MRNKLLKKTVSLVLALMLALSTAAIGVNAATTDETQASESENTIYFDVNSTDWDNIKTIFCHIWRADGTGSWPVWQGKAEKCTYNTSTGIASYDLTKTGNEILPTDGKKYCVIFSANTGMQTYTTIMDGSCIGDTMYCDKMEIENPADNEKKCSPAYWRKNTNCGPQKVITSTGKVYGTTLAEGETDEMLLADYLINYYDDNVKMDYVSNIFYELDVSAIDVFASVKAKEAMAVAENKKTQEQADAEINAISYNLSTVPNWVYPDSIYLNLENSPWSDATSINCHIFNAKTGEAVTSWQSADEKMTIQNGVAYFNIAKSGFYINEYSTAEYGVVFGNEYGSSTYAMTLDGTCLNKHINLCENPLLAPSDDKNKPCIARWEYGKTDCGTHFDVASADFALGAYLYDFENGYDIVADYLISSCIEVYMREVDNGKLQTMLDTLNLDTNQLVKAVVDKLDEKVNAGDMDTQKQAELLDTLTNKIYSCINPVTRKNIYLLPAKYWDTTNGLYCNVRRVDGTGTPLEWHSSAEECTYNVFTGLAFYDLNNTNFNFDSKDVKGYLVMFSNSSQQMTFRMVTDSSCIGDTVVVGEYYPEEGETGCFNYSAKWANSLTCGQIREECGGTIIGDVQPLGETDEMLFANYLVRNWSIPEYMNAQNIEDIMWNLNVSKTALQKELNKKLESVENKDEILNTINAVLDEVNLYCESFGDVNDDLQVTVEDATLLQRILSGTENYEHAGQDVYADANRDGYVTVEDATLIQRIACEVE